MKPGYDYIDCVPKNETETHLKIKQTAYIVPFSQQLTFLYNTIMEHQKSTPFPKIMVFLPTTTVVSYLASVFNKIEGLDIIQLHSKLTQQHRVRISNRFKAAKSGILFTTDVSARGVDYPNVTLVIQLGVPPSQEQYIHRVGRTGRADKDGQAILILAPTEKRALSTLTDVPIALDTRSQYQPTLETAKLVKDAVSKVSLFERVSIFAPWFSYCTLSLC
jgi:ATP-dependent RNA helicase MSS116